MNLDKIHLHPDTVEELSLIRGDDVVVLFPYRGYTISLCIDRFDDVEDPGGSIRVYEGPSHVDSKDITKELMAKPSRDMVGLNNTADTLRTVMNWIDKREGDAHVVYGDQPADPTAKQLLAGVGLQEVAGFEKIGTYVGNGKTHDTVPLDFKRAGVLVDGKFVPSQDQETTALHNAVFESAVAGSTSNKSAEEIKKAAEVLVPGQKWLDQVDSIPDASESVTVERLPSIPVGDMPFHHDRASMYTPLVRGWYVLHGGFDTPSSKIGEGWKGAQYPIQRLDLYNTRTGNAFRLHIGDKL